MLHSEFKYMLISNYHLSVLTLLIIYPCGYYSCSPYVMSDCCSDTLFLIYYIATSIYPLFLIPLFP